MTWVIPPPRYRLKRRHLDRDTDLLARVTRDMPLPPGGVLAFARVGRVTGIDLPDVIRRCAPRRQASFAAGRFAALDALRRAGHLDPVQPGIDGDGLPQWPTGWLGSISHTDDIAAAVIAPISSAQIIGMDVERIVTDAVAAQIAPEVAPELLLVQVDLPFRHEITRAFSAKEALYKALYPTTRKFRDFSAAKVGWRRAGLRDPDQITLMLTEDWGAAWPAGTKFEPVQRIAAEHVATILWH